MRREFRLILVLIFLFFSICQPVPAAIRAEIKFAYFSPKDEAFKDIYGAGPSLGAEIGIKTGHFLAFWASGEYFSKKGKMTFTKEETTLKIMPLAVGLSVALNLGRFSPYAKLGIGFFRYEEINILGKVKKTDIGYLSQGGLVWHIAGPVYLDLFGHYSFCQVKPAEVKADLGGLKAGAGLGFQF